MMMQEIEELIKSTSSAAAKKAILRHAAIIANPESSDELKAQARDNILAISGKKPPSGSSMPTKAESLKNIESAVSAAKPDLANKMNEKISSDIRSGESKQADIKKQIIEAAAEKRAKIKAHEIINGRGPWHSHKIDPLEWEKFHPDVQKFLSDKETPEKKAEREEWNHENQVLPGSEHTRKELAAQVARTEGIEKPKGIKYKENITPKQVAVAAQNKAKSTIDSALNMVNEAHANGLHDRAAQILNAIPQEHMPSNMKGYNPAYIHYDVTPNHWAAMAPEHRDQMHETHLDIMSGKHDNNPDPAVQKIIGKVKPLPKPPSS
jgi:hypothetical protein